MKIVDVTGKKFNRLTVLSIILPYTGRWLCRCDCGNIRAVKVASLNNGGTKSCGCIRAENVRKAIFKDLTGKRFGKLLVIEKSDQKKSGKNKNTLWKCLCDCGKIHFTITSCLTCGHTKSCGCLGRTASQRRMPNETGNRFGKLVVIEKTKTHTGKAVWLCKCDCGGEKLVSGKNLRNGKVKSCGCAMKNSRVEYVVNKRLNLVGKKFGRLNVIKYVGSNERGHSIFECMCECGKSFVVNGYELRCGHTTSCGCGRTDAMRMFNQQPETLDKHRMGMQLSWIKRRGELTMA